MGKLRCVAVAGMLVFGAAPLAVQRNSTASTGRGYLEGLADGLGLSQFTLVDSGRAYGDLRTGNAYLLQRTELTHAQWRAVMNASPGGCTGCEGTLPVTQVSWADVQAFLAALNRRDPGKNYRLPTADEWELGALVSPPASWTPLDSGARAKAPVSVILSDRNAWNLYGMLGNVAEWVESGVTHGSLQSRHERAARAYAAGQREVRGGSFAAPAKAGTQGFVPATTRSPEIGFRLVRDAPAALPPATTRADRAQRPWINGERFEFCEPFPIRSVQDAPADYPPILRAPHCNASDSTVEFGRLNGAPLTGQFATYEKASPFFRSVLLLADAGGLDAPTRALARRLAGEGFVVLAVAVPPAMLRGGARVAPTTPLPPRLPPAAASMLAQAVR